MKFLLTAFEPFDGKTSNSSIAATQEIFENCDSSSWIIQTVVLPVKHLLAKQVLSNTIDDFHPDVVLCFGEAGGRSKISLERIAINFCDFTIPDNSGLIVTEQTIIEGGPAAYFSLLPLRNIQDSLKIAGIPVEISLSAGSYLCNEVFYSLMDIVSHDEKTRIGGFIHLPLLPSVAAESKGNVPSMSVSETRKAVQIIMAECAKSLNGVRL